jgi:hypothetical protein
MGPGLRVSAALAAAALIAAAVPTASPAAAVTRRATAARPPAWRVVRVPSSVVLPADLADVSASGPANAWAVGADAETGFQKGAPLILHWNGRAWSKVALPGVLRPGFLGSVSAGSRSDAWALGTDRSGAVLLHWNGRRWRTVGFPGERTATMMSVAAAPGGRAWMVGWRNETSGVTAILVELWNGTAWHIVPTRLGQGTLSKARVSANGDVWAVGSDVNFFPLIAHEHRGAWTSFPRPPEPTGLNDVLGKSAHDVWTVGIILNQREYVPTISHWDGRAWTTVLVPDPAKFITQDLSISPDGSGRPQWVGAEAGLPHPSATLYAYYNGTAWVGVRGATALSGVFDASTVTAHIPGTNAAWGVGGSVRMRPQGGIAPVRAIIEFNPGPPEARPRGTL